MAAVAQVESLLDVVKPPVPEALKGSMDGEAIPNFIHQCELYYSIDLLSNKNIQALIAIRLL